MSKIFVAGALMERIEVAGILVCLEFELCS
jgi:hypothetical protein